MNEALRILLCGLALLVCGGAGIFGLSFRLRFDRSASPTRIRVTCRVAKVTSDQIDCTADDPDQGKLPL